MSGLSAHFAAGSSQLMHWRSVRPEKVTTGTIRFLHFGQCVIRSIEILPIFSPLTRAIIFRPKRRCAGPVDRSLAKPGGTATTHW